MMLDWDVVRPILELGGGNVKLYLDLPDSYFNGIHSPMDINFKNVGIKVEIRYAGFQEYEVSEYTIEYGD